MSFCHPLPQLLGKLRKGSELRQPHWAPLKWGPSTPSLAGCKAEYGKVKPSWEGVWGCQELLCMGRGCPGSCQVPSTRYQQGG